MEQVWFEMPEIRRRKLANAVWIPMRCVDNIQETGRIGHVGYRSEFYGVGSVAVPLVQRAAAQELEWSDIAIAHSHAGVIQDGRYIPADVFEDRDVTGICLVLEQRGTKLDPSEWHLHQDFVITLGLKREGEIWVRPEEDYIDVVHLRRNDDGSPRLLEVRAEHLRDYLCAHGMALYITSYRDRSVVLNNAAHIRWPEDPYVVNEGMDRWEGRVSEIAPGGMPYGSTTAVFHTSRTDVDPEVDVPAFDFPTDNNVQSKSWTVEHKEEKLYRIEGELWRNEWIDPASSSPRVKGDKAAPTVSFIVDAEGKQENANTLVQGRRWLWFRPEVMSSLAHRRGGALKWYTKDTGEVECSPAYGVHFGVNTLGLINVFAKDIALLPEWQQRIWGWCNVAPDGKVSEELLASQMRATPAQTRAPEASLGIALARINEVAERMLGVKILREHDDVVTILARVHRFRAIDKAGLYALAKDLARLTADSFDATAVQRIIKPPSEKKWASLKSVENLLAVQVGPQAAAAMMAPLFGIYDLRLADAHLASKDADEALGRIGVNAGLPFVAQGAQLLHQCVATLYTIVSVIERWDGGPRSTQRLRLLLRTRCISQRLGNFEAFCKTDSVRITSNRCTQHRQSLP